MSNPWTRIRTLIGIVLSIVCVTIAVISLRGTHSSSGSRHDFEIVQKDQNGDLWSLHLVKGRSLSRLKKIGKKLGPPLLVKVDVTRQNRNVTFGLILEGKAGEKYIAGIRKNGQILPPPRYRIVNESGKILKAGTFEYG
jgi:hypothetical protein